MAFDSMLVSRTLYLVEPESCNNFVQCDPHVNLKLETKLKIPLRNVDMLRDVVASHAQRGCLPKGSGVKRKRRVKYDPIDYVFKIVNSCNGLLCLSEPIRDKPVAVCNPITGEYINLPMVYLGDGKDIYGCGLGFSPRANQYKVIRIFDQWIFHPVTGMEVYGGRKAEIQTLGTGFWRNIGDGPNSFFRLMFTTYLKGGLHWFCRDGGTADHIVSFDFDDECFQSVPLPPRENVDTYYFATPNLSMGILEGCLSISDSTNYDSIHIWVLKKYGAPQSWTKLFSLNTLPDGRSPNCLYQPISYQKDGAVLMFDYSRSALISYDPTGPKFRYLKIDGVKSAFEAISYVPSFISLKDTMVGDNAKVLNTSSRCAKFKMPGETRALSLVEEYNEKPPDSNCSS